MNNVMLDIETMGTTGDAAIIAIGACYFDPMTGQIGDKFYEKVNLESSVERGGKVGASTVLWWLQQSDGARAEFKDNHTAARIEAVLSNFSNFLKSNVIVWGNGISFDNVIVKRAYERNNIPVPWKFWNEHDVRTVVAMGKLFGIDPKRDIPFEGDKHNALSDAVHQARYVSAIWVRVAPPRAPTKLTPRD